MDPKEIKSRAALLKNLPMNLVNLQQAAWIADIDRVTLWRLPPEEKPQTMRIGGSEMLQVDAAVAWATEYWAKKGAA